MTVRDLFGLLIFDNKLNDGRPKCALPPLFRYFISVKGRLRFKLLRSSVKITITLLYKNVRENDSSRNSMWVVLISTILLGPDGPPRLMMGKSRN